MNAPEFDAGASASLSVTEDSTNNAINAELAVTDGDNGQTLTWSVASSPANGTLGGFDATATSTAGSVTPSGLTYTPNGGYTGSDSFDIQVADGTGGTDTITVNVTVNPGLDCTDMTAFAAASPGDYCLNGDIYAGSPSAGKYLIAAPADESGTYEWSNISGIHDADSNTDGYANTQWLATSSGYTHEAADQCWNKTLNGYSDWYLPAQNELNQLYTDLHDNGGLGGFSDTNYWSSTDPNSPGVRLQNFLNGNQSNSTEHEYYAVRCVRSVYEPEFDAGASASLSVTEDSTNNAINAELAVTDGDNGQTLTWSVASSPANGTLGGFDATETSTAASVTPSGLTYTPNGGYTGSDSFDIQVADGTGGTDIITVNVTVSASGPACSGGWCVFVTSTYGSGDISTWSNSSGQDGVQGADHICETLASNAGLVGTYRPWLATSDSNDPDSRFANRGTNTGFYRPDGVRVANNWADLTDGTLDNPITHDENGNDVTGTGPFCCAGKHVYTNVDILGQHRTINNDCGNYTNTNSNNGSSGEFQKTDTTWTDHASSADCHYDRRLYCFQTQ
jgi:hypothetical protein